jgi:hypothetical protein
MSHHVQRPSHTHTQSGNRRTGAVTVSSNASHRVSISDHRKWRQSTSDLSKTIGQGFESSWRTFENDVMTARASIPEYVCCLLCVV